MKAARRAVFSTAVLAVLIAGSQVAIALWATTSNAQGFGKARTMPTGAIPSVAVSGTSVTLGWSASTFAGGGAVDGYVVKRYHATSDVLKTTGAGCSGTISALTCVETGVPVGSWKYTVTPKHASWTGTEGAKSATASVSAALSVASLGIGHPAAANPMVTATITPTTSVVFLWVHQANGFGSAPTVSGVSGLSCTWAAVPGASVTSANSARRMSTWVGTGCSGSGTISVTQSATPTATNAYSVVEVRGGVDVTSPYVSTSVKTAATGNAVGVSATPNALASSQNAFLVAINHATAENVSPTHASATEVNDGNAANAGGVETNALVGWTNGAMGGSWGTNAGAQATLVGLEVRVATAPPAPSITSSPSAVSNQTSATFSFTDSQAGVTFQCRLDGAAYSPCTSPASFTGLAEGSHTFDVVAVDPTGAESPATSFTWTVDTTPPPIPSITAAPANPAASTSASFSFTDTESGVTFQCKLDGGAYGSCSSPRSYSSLAEGSHTFSVKAADAAGNESPAATATWTVDVTAPPAPSITASPSSPTSSTSASFSFTDTEPGVTFQCQIDGGGYSSCTSPRSYSSLSSGSHTFGVRAVDAAGNQSAATTATWTIDTTAPAVTTTFPADGSILATNGTYLAGCGTASTYDLCGTSSDAIGVATVRISLRRPGGLYWNGTSFASSSEVLLTPTGTTSWSYVFSAFPVDGSYTLRAVATDTAGNTSSTSTAFTIDDTAPAVAVTFPANGATYGNAQFSAGCASAGVCGTASDATSLSGVTVSIRQSSTGNYFNGTSFAAATEQQLAVSGTTAWAYAIAATTFPAEGSYVVRATATDSAGTTTSATSTFTFDRTGPSGTDVSTTNAGTAGRPEKNDTVSFTFSETVSPGSVLAGWSGSATDVSVRINDGGAGNDTLQIWNAANTAMLPMGSVDLGRSDYVTANVVFRGNGANASTMVRSGTVITVTLGSPSSGAVGTAAAAASVAWTPSATVTDLYGNAASTTAVTRSFLAF